MGGGMGARRVEIFYNRFYQYQKLFNNHQHMTQERLLLVFCSSAALLPDGYLLQQEIQL